MEERRRHKRYKADLEVEYEVENTVAIQSKTHTVNISEGGVGLPLNKAVRPGKKIRLKIKLPDEDREVVALGKVVWKEPINRNLVDEEDAGVKFLGVYDDGMEALNEYIARSSYSS